MMTVYGGSDQSHHQLFEMYSFICLSDVNFIDTASLRRRAENWFLCFKFLCIMKDFAFCMDHFVHLYTQEPIQTNLNKYKYNITLQHYTGFYHEKHTLFM